MRIRQLIFLSLVATGSVGCGDSPGDDDPCTSENPGSTCINSVRFDFEPGDVDIVGDLAADGIEFSTPADTEGFQITTEGVRLAPGDDDEWCEAFEVPPHPDGPDATWCITRFEVAMTRGYHHLFVSHAPPGSVSEGLIEVGQRVRCVGGAHVTYGSDLLPIPLPQGTYVDVPYYEGVGLQLKEGQKLSVNYHYLNAGDEDTIAVTKLNFHAAECEGLVEMRQFGFYNNDISIPAHDEGQSAMSRTFSQDVYVYDLFRHTHRLGVDTPIKFYKGPRDGEVVFISPDYEQGAGYRFEEPQLLHAGEGFTIECNWFNDTDEVVTFGPTADDEMCMLLGTWWVANPEEAPEVQHRYKWPQ